MMVLHFLLFYMLLGFHYYFVYFPPRFLCSLLQLSCGSQVRNLVIDNRLEIDLSVRVVKVDSDADFSVFLLEGH